MNNRQIVFITCVNDEEEYAECRYYLERLRVPEGYGMDIISIQGAPSAAAGYNAGMKSSDAKYKVYLHQDVFVKNRDFISDMLAVFARDEQIGMLGMVGNRMRWENMSYLMVWDTGKTIDSSKAYFFRFPEKEEGYVEVNITDGLLLATQYDLYWREDIFDSWHFYDQAQCMEFKKAGYKVVVPWQQEAWCYHDNKTPDISFYFDYYERFLHEYGDCGDFPVTDKRIDGLAYGECQDNAQMEKNLQKMVEALFDKGDRITMRSLFEDPVLQGQRCLQEYETIIRIDQQEEESQSLVRFWESGMSIAQLISKLRTLRHVLKRIEYGACVKGQVRDWIMANYSIYALKAVRSCQLTDAEKIDRMLKKFNGENVLIE